MIKSSLFILSNLILLTLLVSLFGTSLCYADVSGQNLLTKKEISVKPGTKGTVLIFMSSHCPCSNSHTDIVKKLAQDFSDFAFVVVHSNSDEDVTQAREYFQKLAWPFPVIQDQNSKLANEFKASKTPHAFLILPDSKIVYKGGVTNSVVGSNADKNFLRDALMDIEAKKPVRLAVGRTLGCAISR